MRNQPVFYVLIYMCTGVKHLKIFTIHFWGGYNNHPKWIYMYTTLIVLIPAMHSYSTRFSVNTELRLKIPETLMSTLTLMDTKKY